MTHYKQHSSNSDNWDYHRNQFRHKLNQAFTLHMFSFFPMNRDIVPAILDILDKTYTDQLKEYSRDAKILKLANKHFCKRCRAETSSYDMWDVDICKLCNAGRTAVLKTIANERGWC